MLMMVAFSRTSRRQEAALCIPTQPRILTPDFLDSCLPSLRLGREVRQLDFTHTVKFQDVAADFVADALGVFGGVVFHFHLEKEIGTAHRLKSLQQIGRAS